MRGWETYCLNDVITIRHGWAFKGEFFSEEPTDDILITPGNFLIGGGFKVDKLKYYKGEYPKDYLLKEGDVIVTMTDLSKEGDTLGYSAKVPSTKSQRFLHNQRIGLVKLKTEIFNLDFIYWLLRTRAYQGYIAASASGATVRHTSPTKIGSYKFKAPSNKNVQSKIALVLSAYDDLIENNLKRIKQLEQIAQIGYRELFGKVRDLPKGWEIKKIGEVCKATGGGTPSKTVSKFWNNGDISWFSPTDLTKSNSIFQLDSSNKITDEGLKNSSAKLLQPNSFMFSSRATIGLFGIVDKPFCTNQGFINVTPKEDFHKEFLFYNFLSRIDEFKGHATGATFPELTKSKFNALSIIFPDENTLKKFHEFIKPIHELLGNLSKQNHAAKEARDILLPRLMAGIIEVEAAEAKTVSFLQPKQKETSWEFKEAVLISMLVYKFGSNEFPLGRKRYTKLSYLFHRHAKDQIENYLRKAAGPYNPKTKYEGPEKISIQNSYIVPHTIGQYAGYVAGKNISVAKTYFEQHWNINFLKWLDESFRYKSNDELELYATVDNAMLELHNKNYSVNVNTIKEILKNESEWKAKLKRPIFNDANIQKAITYLRTLFQYS